MLDALLRWARAEGLLRGQRNRQLDSVLKKIRNDVAHGGGHHLVMPVDSARTISGPAGCPPDSQFADWTCVLVRAVPHDEGLSRLDALYESTTYPCDLLWGPGTWEDACAWLEQEQPPGDEVDVLDRLFLVQRHQARIYLPRSPDIAAGLAEEERHGTWYLTRADYPSDALRHARAVTAGQCSPGAAPCAKCPAESVGIGTWLEMLTLAANTGLAVTPRRPPQIAVPSIRAWPRYFEIADDG